jgi:hypothetical protein
LVFQFVCFYGLTGHLIKKQKNENQSILNVIAPMLTSAQNTVMLNIAFQKTLQMEKYSITVVCPHDIAETRVIESIATCETTVLVCTECGEELEKPKTEC